MCGDTPSGIVYHKGNPELDTGKVIVGKLEVVDSSLSASRIEGDSLLEVVGYTCCVVGSCSHDSIKIVGCCIGIGHSVEDRLGS